MAEENAKLAYIKTREDQENMENSLSEAQSLLSLRKIPKHIHAFDISTTFGVSSVGGVVSFVDGKPDKSGYRRFSIKEVEGIDDYAMIDETLARHYRKIQREGGELPDLVLIDGGKGHLNRAILAMKRLGLEEIELASIAKGKDRNKGETDEIFRPGMPDPITSQPHHPGRRLLQIVRDEVHRFSITAHRKLRQKKSKYSILEEIQGVGPQRRLALMKHFKGLDAMKKATLEEFQSVPGITATMAQRIKEALGKEDGSIPDYKIKGIGKN
jgi:excinuclease ABC subunit C